MGRLRKREPHWPNTSRRRRQVRSRLKTAIKYARVAIAGSDGAAASDALRKAEREIRKAASKGVLSKTQASRRVSRLAHSLAAKS
ncbi:MAG: 30S ribosomal protein S20 [Deltaproteobacteria bacterium]|nr:MAG: 30S ribosomal protein S20 [Deltaproteobacteria bacterium]